MADEMDLVEHRLQPVLKAPARPLSFQDESQAGADRRTPR
jgi:hypothetical protein